MSKYSFHGWGSGSGLGDGGDSIDWLLSCFCFTISNIICMSVLVIGCNRYILAPARALLFRGNFWCTSSSSLTVENFFLGVTKYFPSFGSRLILKLRIEFSQLGRNKITTHEYTECHKPKQHVHQIYILDNQMSRQSHSRVYPWMSRQSHTQESTHGCLDNPILKSLPMDV